LEGGLRESGYDYPETSESKSYFRVLYKEQGCHEQAAKYLRRAVDGRQIKLGDKHPLTLESIKNLIALYEASGKHEKAEEWRTKLTQIEDSKE